MGQINNVYFSQIELESIISSDTQSCMKVDNVCLSYIDGILAQIPLMMKVQINNNIEIKDLKLSNDKIYINSSSKYIDSKTSNKLSVLFIVMSIFVFIQVIINNQISSSIPNKIESIKIDKKLPASSIQMKSIIKTLEKQYNTQAKLRDKLKYILLSTNIKDGKIKLINIKDKKIIITYKNIKKNKVVEYE